MAASLAAIQRPQIGASNTVYKSGPLFISSKGLGWTSWKKRWFILTRTSLVFFKTDPSVSPQKGGEVNLTLGGIDLNSSGSVVVREDKKLLTVLFPDGRDGRAFTLKAESLEDLYEWKAALEQALAQAPNAALVIGQNGIFRTEANNTIEGSFNAWRDQRPLKSSVVGRPILLALEEIDGSPSFLEKALQFLETNGTNVEGILRQSADVEEVERRVYEYEQGKTDFGPEEDPHVVGDCVKHVLRQLPSSPVPASCCTALLEAYKIDHNEARVKSLRSAIVETFPEPNRRLLLRILKMMHTITSHSFENRMTPSAVAACMSPLLLRPLLAGECDLEGFDALEDNSAQLLAAANAANNAQAIVTALLEDYGNMINDEGLQRCSTSTDSHIGESGPENSSDEEDIEVKRPDLRNVEIEDGETDDDNGVMLSRKPSESSGYAGSDLYDYKEYGVEDSDAESPKDIHCSVESTDFPTRVKRQIEEPFKDIEIASVSPTENCYQSGREAMPSVSPSTPLTAPRYTTSAEKPANKNSGLSTGSAKRSSPWGRSSGQKTPAKGSFDGSGNDELLIQRLELMKDELRQRIAKEAKGNAVLQASLERRKQALHERRLALEQDVGRLQEQLQAERDLRSALEVGLTISCGHFSSQAADSKTRAELEEIALAEADVARLKQKVAELHHQLSQQRHHHLSSLPDAQSHHQFLQNHNTQLKSFQQDFDSILAFVNQERNQRTDESSLRAEWRNGRGNNRQVPGSPRLNEASLGIPMEEVMEYARHEHNNNHPPPPAASAALMELTTRLDFFKERRSQLMQQIQNLDLNYGTSSSSSVHRSSSPPWN
ncbi:Rho GTPase-activating protein 6 [Hirschfeldia incana]|nr:Rho GTPase-activating protein 6 [Hirschfeldia incana]